MIAASLPQNEKARLDALRGYNILDTAPEREYEDFTLIAAQICGTPIALISLIDDHRQWFKSKVGLDAPETSRELAFCAHAILEPSEVFEVSDALEDLRFADNPLVTQGPKIRFYAGAPLVTPGNHAVGTLCVIDRTPRHLDGGQRAALEALARQVVSQLELRKARASLAERNELLRELHHEKTQFMGMAAHDLRNPLQVIDGYGKLLLNGVLGAVSPPQGQALAAIAKNCAFMLNMVNDLLSISTTDGGAVRLDPQPTDPGSLVEKSVALNRLLSEAKQIHIDLEIAPGLPPVLADAFKIEQILNNLLSNAVKFSHPGTRVAVRVEPVPGGVEISVRDQGQGIPVEDLDKLFLPFARVSVRSTAGEPSTGLGLSIVKRIVESHGGSLRVESRPGEGSLFSFTIPRA